MDKKYMNLIDLLQNNQDINKRITFVKSSTENKIVSYEQLFQIAKKYLYILQEKGLKKGDELVIQIEDNEIFLYLFWSCILGGIIPVPVTFGINNEQRLKIIKIWGFLKNPFLVTDVSNNERIQKFCLNNNYSSQYEIINSKTILIDEIVLTDNTGIIENINKNDIALVQFSSGSTGDPQGITLTHKNLITNLSAMCEAARWSEKDSFLSWMPLTHDMGLIGFHLNPVFNSSNQYIMPTSLFIRRAALWMELASQYKITTLCSPNFGYKHYLNAICKKEDIELDLSHVRIIFNGAEPISIHLCHEYLNEMAKFGLNKKAMLPVYGLAEASLAVTIPPLEEEEIISFKLNRNHLNIFDKVEETNDPNLVVNFVDEGYPIQDCKLRICDNDHNTLEDYRIGLVYIKGDSVTSGYYNNPVATSKNITSDGWLNTGDLGFMHDGRLVITGRAKEIIIVNGQNFYPYDLERIAQNIETIELGKIAIAGIQKEEREEVVAFIASKEKLENFISIALNVKHDILSQTGVELTHIIPIRSIPKTTSGKIQRIQLANQYQNGEFDDVINQINELVRKESEKRNVDIPISETEKSLVELCKGVLKIKNIGIHDNFLDLGGNSLLLNQIHEKLETAYPGKVEITDFFAYPNISKLARYIVSKKNNQLNQFVPKYIRFPQSFYNNKGEGCTNLNFSFSKEINNKLLTIKNNKIENVEELVLSAFVIIFLKYMQQNIVSFYLMIKEKDWFSQHTIDLSKIKDMSEVVNIIQKEIVDNSTLYNINTINITNKKNDQDILFLFYRRSLYSTEISSTRVFDLSIGIKKGQDNISCICEYKDIIKKAKMGESIYNVIQLVQSMVDFYYQPDQQKITEI